MNKSENKLIISGSQKSVIDDVFLKYPFMFSKKIRDLWKNEIQFLKSEISNSLDTLNSLYGIPREFIDVFGQEYEQKLNKYDQLVGTRNELEKYSTT